MIDAPREFRNRSTINVQQREQTTSRINNAPDGNLVINVLIEFKIDLSTRENYVRGGIFFPRSFIQFR